MSHFARLRLRYLALVLMCVPALGADGCNCRGRSGHSDDNQGLPSPGSLAFSQASFPVSAFMSSVTVTVNRTGGTAGPVSVTYATADGTATSASGDYTPATGTLSWADGDSAPQSFTVTFNDDLVVEGDETINLSLSAPTGGATLGAASASITLVEAWTKLPANPVLSSGPAGDFDEWDIEAASVLKDGTNSYLMYYEGGNAIDDHIGRVTSSDGILWNRPTPNTSLLAPFGAPRFDRTFLWRPCVIKESDTNWKMWYTGVHVASNTFSRNIGLATWDGVPANPWTRVTGTAAPPGTLGEGAVLIGGTDMTWETHTSWGCVILDGPTYKMWYTGTGSGTGFRSAIGYATSTDGITWSKPAPHPSPQFDVTGAGWEALAVGHPWVVKDGGVYKMWYLGLDSTGKRRIGYARSTNGTTWTRYAGNPILDVGGTGTWDSAWVHYPSVIPDGPRFKMWYSGSSTTAGATEADFKARKIGYASNP